MKMREVCRAKSEVYWEGRRAVVLAGGISLDFGCFWR